MADEQTSFIEKQGALSKATQAVLMHVMAVVAVMFSAAVCFCECYMCVWHSHQADYNYALPNEMWIIVMSIIGFLFGKKIGETQTK